MLNTVLLFQIDPFDALLPQFFCQFIILGRIVHLVHFMTVAIIKNEMKI